VRRVRGSSDLSGRGSVAGATFETALLEVSAWSSPDNTEDTPPGLKHCVRRDCSIDAGEG
jgi:hypothetical protein